MKNIAILILSFSCYFGFSQTTFPQGIYMNIRELSKKTPSSTTNLSVEKRTPGQIKMTGGNDYKVTSNDKSFSKKEIRKNILAYSTGDTLFINGFRYKIQDEFAKILNNGRFLMFVGGLSSEPYLNEYQMEQGKTSTFWGNFGALGGGMQGAKTALLRFPYVLDTKEDTLIYLNQDTLRKLLAENNLDLLHQYDKEKEGLDSSKENAEANLLLKYVDLLNTTD